MPTFSLQAPTIEAIYACVPPNRIKTEEYPGFNAEQRALFTKSTGVIERRVADDKTTCSDLCYQAAVSLLSDLNVKEEIDLVLFVSQSPDYFLPSTAVLLQERLGLTNQTMAFDINLGCSGYGYGLTTAAQFIQTGSARKVLLLVGDKSTLSTHPEDRSTTPLFGDAGTATLLGASTDPGAMVVDAGSDGKGNQAIIIPGGHSRHPYGTFSNDSFEVDGIVRTKNHLHLDGFAVFNFALQRVPLTLQRVLNAASFSMDDIDWVVFHQANKLISSTIEKKLKISPEKVLHSIESFGNTSSASIPLTIAWNADKGIPSKSFTWLLCGFGVGLSWSTVCLTMPWPKTKVFDYEG